MTQIATPPRPRLDVSALAGEAGPKPSEGGTARSATELVRAGPAKGLVPGAAAWTAKAPPASVRERFLGAGGLAPQRAAAEGAGPAARETRALAAALQPAYGRAHDPEVPAADRAAAARALLAAQAAPRAAVAAELGAVEARLAEPGQADMPALRESRRQLLLRAIAVELPLLASAPELAALAEGLAALRDRLPPGSLRDLAGGALVRTLAEQHPLHAMRTVVDGSQPRGADLAATLAAAVRVLGGDDEALSLNLLNGLKLGATPLRALTTELRSQAFEQRAAQAFRADAERLGGADLGPAGGTAPARMREALRAGGPDLLTAFEGKMAAARALAGTHEALQEQLGRLGRTIGPANATLVASQLLWAVSSYIDSDAEVAAGRRAQEAGEAPVRTERGLLELETLKAFASMGEDGAFQIARYAQLLEEAGSQQAALFGQADPGAAGRHVSAERVVALLGLDPEKLKTIGYEAGTAQEVFDTSVALGRRNMSDRAQVRAAVTGFAQVGKETLGDVNNQRAINSLAAKRADLAARNLVDTVREQAFRSLHPTRAEPGTPAEKTEALKRVVIGLQAKILGDKNPTGHYALMLKAGAQRDRIERDLIDLHDRKAALQERTDAHRAALAAQRGAGAAAEEKPDGLGAAKVLRAAAEEIRIANGTVGGIRMAGMAERAARSVQALAPHQLERMFDKAEVARIKADGPSEAEILRALPGALAVIALREEIPKARAELKAIEEGIRTIEASRDKRVVVGAEGSVVTGLKRLVQGRADLQVAAALAWTGSSDLRRAFELDETAHDALDRVIRMVASEVMLETTGGAPGSTFEPARHRDAIEERLRAVGVDTAMMSASITALLRAPMTDASVEAWAAREAKFDDFREALGTAPSFFSSAGFAEQRQKVLNVGAVKDAVALQVTKQARMDERTARELSTLVGALKPGDSFAVSGGQVVAAKWTQKLDPALLSSVTVRLSGQTTRDLVIRRTEGGWEVGGLKGLKATAGVQASVGLSPDSFRDTGFTATGFRAEAVLTGGLGVGGGSSRGEMLTLADGKAVVEALMATLDGEPPGRDVIDAMRDPTAVSVTFGQVEAALSGAARIGFRAAHAGADTRGGSWTEKPGGLTLGVAARAAASGDLRSESGTSLDRTYRTETTRYEVSFGITPSAAMDLQALGKAAGAAARGDVLAGNLNPDTLTNLKASAAETAGKQGFGLAATGGNALLGLIAKEALGAIPHDLVWSKAVTREMTVRNLRVGDDASAELDQATIVQRTQVRGVLDTAQTLWGVLNRPTRDLLEADPALRDTFRGVLDAAAADAQERSLEVISTLTPAARDLVQGLNRLQRAAAADGDTELARMFKSEANAVLGDEANFQPCAVRLLRDRDTAGVDTAIPLYVIDIARAHGLASRQEIAAARFAGRPV
ncbi:hypothetical protein BHAOGJBA_5028 [Methylobacterium hispanicum]|uniref:Uncharacterized protein n=1 Tax=Methylobacterium hispanicum TaxID=270350 RepID=A0AAV4ZU05_9HYPH|nr:MULTISPECIES: hypothetical protein [Methylobacterium]GJD91480.1 hypothetical protein BHAOGJBA_5028 [Methylobacterium hispanicum]